MPVLKIHGTTLLVAPHWCVMTLTGCSSCGGLEVPPTTPFDRTEVSHERSGHSNTIIVEVDEHPTEAELLSIMDILFADYGEEVDSRIPDNFATGDSRHPHHRLANWTLAYGDIGAVAGGLAPGEVRTFVSEGRRCSEDLPTYADRIEAKARIDGATDLFVTHTEVMVGKNASTRYRLALVGVDPRGARHDEGRYLDDPFPTTDLGDFDATGIRGDWAKERSKGRHAFP